MNKKVFCFDLDGVICTKTDGNYDNAKPNTKMIKIINNLYNQGHSIKIHTSRFMKRNDEDIVKAYLQGFNYTKNQLKMWGVKYNNLIMGKLCYDYVIDDRAINSVNFEKDYLKFIKNIEEEK